MNMISKKIIVKTAAIISKSCMYYRGISNSHNKIGKTHDMLNFEIICFSKVGYEDNSFKPSVRVFHSLMGDGIQDFCEILVRL